MSDGWLGARDRKLHIRRVRGSSPIHAAGAGGLKGNLSSEVDAEPFSSPHSADYLLSDLHDARHHAEQKYYRYPTNIVAHGCCLSALWDELIAIAHANIQLDIR